VQFELYSLLATAILLISLATIVFSIYSYILFRVREGRKLKKTAGHGHGVEPAAPVEAAPAEAPRVIEADSSKIEPVPAGRKANDASIAAFATMAGVTARHPHTVRQPAGHAPAAGHSHATPGTGTGQGRGATQGPDTPPGEPRFFKPYTPRK